VTLELRHFRLVVAVADHGSIGAAARTLGLAQAGVSAQLARLERSMRTTLFLRGPDGVTPTTAGRLVIDRARGVLGQIDTMADDLATLAPDATAVSVGGITSNWFARFLAPAIAARSLPLASRTDSSSTTVDKWFADGEIDVAVVALHPGFGDVIPVAGARQSVLIEEQPYLVALGDRHPASSQDDVALADLSESPWLLPRGRPDGTLSMLLAACRDDGFEPASPTGPADLDFYTTWVTDHGAVCLCSPAYQPRPGLRTLPVRGKRLRSRYVVRWHPSRIDQEEVAELRVLLAAAYVEQVLISSGTADWWHRSPEYRPTLPADLRSVVPELAGEPVGDR
jgi:DNA-binding transcriptional LysR family regulator